MPPVATLPAPATLLAVLAVGLSWLSGCTWITYLGTDPTGREFGKTYYVGGAGPFGHVGTIDVPNGLRQAGYRGAIEAFGWQSIIGGTLRDQTDRSRNEHQAQRLARRIEAYLGNHPGRRVNIIALSAGTGIAAWALEALPENVSVGTVVFLGSSLSRDYDLGPALSRIDDQLYAFYSPDDPILRHFVSVAGTVDREFSGPNVAGLYGFGFPLDTESPTAKLYAERLVGMPYRRRYGKLGYRGMHTDSTSVAFVREVLAPLLMRPLHELEPFDPEAQGRSPPPVEQEPDANPTARTATDRRAG